MTLRREHALYAGLAVLLALVWLSTLAGRPLFNPDEGRYAEIPREMASGGDWVVPHLNGLAYIEKPPLQYWATALCYELFGANAFAARLYLALTALMTVLVAALLSERLFGPGSGWRAAAVLSGMFIFLVLGQLLTLDMSLTFYMTLGVAGFLMAQQAPQRHRSWMLLAWSAAALGVLTKGVVAVVIPSAVLVLYSLASRDFAPWRRLNLSWGLPLFLGLTIPWHWLAARRLDDFLQFYFVHEHLARYLTPAADRQEPWWFFGFVFLAGTVPWTLPALRVLAGGWRRTGAAGDFNAALFLWIWVVFVIGFFSLSDSKLMPYILPAMPPLAMLIAALPAATLARDFLWTAVFTAVVGAALGVASFNWRAVLSGSDRAAVFLPVQGPAREIALLLVLTGVFVGVQRARDVTRSGVFLGVGWCLSGLLLVRAAAWAAPIYSGVALAAGISPADGDAPIYSVGTYNQSLTFYLRRTVMLVGYRGELDYGLRKDPAAAIADLPEFVRVWTAQARAFAVMDNAAYMDLKERGLPMRIISHNWGQVLVARQ